MTYPHLFGYVLVGAIVWWLFVHEKKHEPMADVELGEPTVTGSGSERLGGTDYLTQDAASTADEVIN